MIYKIWNIWANISGGVFALVAAWWLVEDCALPASIWAWKRFNYYTEFMALIYLLTGHCRKMTDRQITNLKEWLVITKETPTRLNRYKHYIASLMLKQYESRKVTPIQSGTSG
jgi:hypothetical protein